MEGEMKGREPETLEPRKGLAQLLHLHHVLGHGAQDSQCRQWSGAGGLPFST